MNRIWRMGAFALVLAAFVAGSIVPAAASGGGKQVVGYFIEWGVYGRNYLVKDIVTNGSAGQLTTINYAFGNVAPVEEGGQVVCKLGDEWADYQMPWTPAQSVDGLAVTWPNPILGNFQQLKQLKAMYPNIKVVISLGGWTWSKYFSDAALTPASREAFVKSCVDLFIKGDLPDPGWGGMGGPGAAAGVFDGIDIDWEYPAAEGNPGNIYRPEDTQNFTLLLAEFRSQLNAVKPGLLLTIAAPAGKDKYSLIELKKISASVDWINLMTYDFHGPWDMRTNFQSNLHTSVKDWSEPRFGIDNVVKGYLSAGVPKNKLIVGMPFYGHGWTGVTNVNHGLYQAVAGPAPATWEAGTEDYKVLKAKFEQNLFQRYWDNKSQAAWLFDGTTFWTYDDAYTAALKATYVREKSLRGVMFWELSGDDGTLVNAIASGLHP
jgi:chitinase